MLDRLETIFTDKLKEGGFSDTAVRVGHEDVGKGEFSTAIVVFASGFTPTDTRELRERNVTMIVSVVSGTVAKSREIGEGAIKILEELEDAPGLEQVVLSGASFFSPDEKEKFYNYQLTYNVIAS